MDRIVEFQVRGVIAEHLGVDPADVGPDVSLRDELAVDSLDMVEMAVVLEERLGILIPDGVIDRARTCGDLVSEVVALVRQRSQDGVIDQGPPPFVRASVTPAIGSQPGRLLCADRLTPYTTEIITEAALHAGKGVDLDLALPVTATDRELAEAEGEFAWLRDHDVKVAVRRDAETGHAAMARSRRAS